MADHAVPQSALANDGWIMSENTSRKVYSLTETDLENIKAILHEPPSEFVKTHFLKYYSRSELVVSIITGRLPKV